MTSAIAINGSAQASSLHIVTSDTPSKQSENGQRKKSMATGKNSTAPRGRRERPCDACRKRKSKCVTSEGQKSCAACEQHRQSCTYIEDPQPRKRRQDGDGKELESSKRRSTVSPVQNSQVSVPSVKYENESHSPSVDSNSPIQTFRDDHRRPSQSYSTHIGPTTELETILLDLSSLNNHFPSSNTYQKPDSRTAFLVDQSGAERSKALNSTALDSLERLVGSHSSPLIQQYLTISHRNFPIIEEEFFMDCQNGRKAEVDPCLLAAIYTLAVPWLSRDTSKFSSKMPDLFQLEDTAFRLFGNSLGKPTLSSIQAGLLLMQRPNVDTKTLNTQVVGAAYELGLHLDCGSWTIPVAEKGLRKRLASAVYVQDKWCSLIHGRPSAISKSNWAVQGLVDGDFDPFNGTPAGSPSQEECERGRALFIQMVKLTEVLSVVLDTFYTLQAMKEVDDAANNGTRLILERAKPVQIKLKEWFTELPSTLKMDNTMTGKPSSTGYLHLAYFATEITLHRCIIRSLELSDGDPYLTHICRSAAKTRLISAMDFVNRLRPEHLNAFWYFPSKVNFALIGTFGSLLLATSPFQEEVDFYRTRLSEYRWTLSVSSRTADFLYFAIESLDSSSTLLRNLPRKASTSEAVTKLADLRTTQTISPSDELMTEAPSLHLGQLPGLETGLSSAASGLVSPSTSTSSGSTSYEAYVGAFPSQRSS